MIMVSIGTFNWASFKNLREHSLDANIVMIATVAVTVFTLTEPKRVLIAFDGGSMTRRGVEMVAASPLFRGLSVHVLMSGKPRRDSEKQLDWARSTLEETGFEVSLALIHGDTERVIAQYVHEQSIDMLLMGAYGHSPLRSLFLGSKTTDLLRSAKVPTLLLR
ncbi:hypothetical protein CCR82_06455 [Halochromatium salexigens]|uniref:UspA domain-containing protein n=3 Tax=Halochromatium salexigens TaxID=49447 RepID=A0AAJ0UEW6_HALSE|nr:hypothetical protein [Halochromatium salexigens]